MAPTKPRASRSKKATAAAATAPDAAQAEAQAEATAAEQLAPPPQHVKAVYNAMDPSEAQNLTLGPPSSDDEHVVLKLNIRVQPTEEGSKLPEPYNDMHMLHQEWKSEAAAAAAAPRPDADVDAAAGAAPQEHVAAGGGGGADLKVIKLLKDFEEKNKNNEWPSTTSIHCYWCCHRFDNAPFGIPVKYLHQRFHVYGCFCSLECATAYNFHSNESVAEIWERYNLINMLSRMIGHTATVKAAPNRLALKMFGGHLAIEPFRAFFQTNKMININFPPMMTLTQQVEEINQSDLNNEYKYIPIDTERINKYTEKIKLKRNKPVTDYKNTLDHTMNLKYQAT